MHNLILKLLSVATLFLLAAYTARSHTQRDKFVLVIDAGHGGKDGGAIGRISKEKNINLKVALAFGRMVEANCPDVRVVYTRKTDIFVPLQRRADIANEQKADLFISIHTNALPKGKVAYGTETYTLGMSRAEENLEVAKRENSVITYESNYQQVYQGFDPQKIESYIIFELLQDKNMAQSVELARSIEQQYISQAGRRSKGVHQGGLLVLRNTSMPAVLTELGFISTEAEERFLNSSAGITKMARSLYYGFVNYRRKYDKSVAPPVAKPELPSPSTFDSEEVEKNTTADKGKTDEKTSPATPKEEATVSSKVSERQEKATAASTTAQSNQAKAETGTDEKPVFKVQLLVSDKQLKPNDRRLKGIKPVEFYKENGLYKYTYGSSTNYSEIKAKHKSVANKLPGTFIVAFRNGERMNLQEAIRLSKK